MAATLRQGIEGALGDIKKRQEGVRSCRGGPVVVIWCWRYLLEGGVYQLASEAFLSDLGRTWGYQIIWGLIWDMYEVHRCSTWMEGANCSYWWTWFGRSNGQSQRVVQKSKYSKTQSNFKCKSINYVWLTIINSFTWTSTSWSDVRRWARNMLTETNFFLPIYGTVLRKTWIYP